MLCFLLPERTVKSFKACLSLAETFACSITIFPGSCLLLGVFRAEGRIGWF